MTEPSVATWAAPETELAAGTTRATGGRPRFGQIRLHIECLVIDGVPGRAGERFAAAFVDELRRLAGVVEPTGRPGRAPTADAELAADPERDPVGAGRLVAAAAHSRLLGAGHG